MQSEKAWWTAYRTHSLLIQTSFMNTSDAIDGFYSTLHQTMDSIRFVTGTRYVEVGKQGNENKKKRGDENRSARPSKKRRMDGRKEGKG